MSERRARAVLVGAGIAGASIAYHLARRGWTDLLVLEQGALVSGTTSHAPGLVGQLRASPALTRLLMESVALYRTLDLDGVPGYLGEGSLRVASSKGRWSQLQQQAAAAQRVGLEAHLVGPDEALRLFPLMSPAGLEGGLYLPTDGSATAPVLARALIRRAQAAGVLFQDRTPVRAVEVADGRVRAVRTEAGRIETETLILASGIWSPRVGALAGVPIPLTPMQHQYAVTADLPALAGRLLPNLRDPDKLIYLRQRDQHFLIGGYERNPRVFEPEAIPESADPTVLPFDSAHFEPLRQACAERVPALADAALARPVNGLESFTPDGEFLLGPAPGMQGVWAACGFCAHGVSGSGGVGKALADWIVDGDPGLDLSEMALARFAGRTLDRAAIQEGACRIYRTYYDLPPDEAPSR